MLVDPFGLGKIVRDGLVFQQNFSIRSKTALNHAKTVGLLGDGFGSTEAMTSRNLIWVVAKMQISRESLSYLLYYFEMARHIYNRASMEWRGYAEDGVRHRGEW
ncbi:hypothetical protein IFM89_039240 [Coptis chinensis]|uniref:Uncharacterized protein n=1 Tax=Coptis chinensis TaxID=261450 RepID=A0A835M683_9MAGN|nr:hypothetical protein IFM89_039240 [Coptis chinensis]